MENPVLPFFSDVLLDLYFLMKRWRKEFFCRNTEKTVWLDAMYRESERPKTRREKMEKIGFVCMFFVLTTFLSGTG